MADHSKLEVQQEGLDVLRRIKGTVCPVAVIGPYRSGKVGAAAAAEVLSPARHRQSERRKDMPWRRRRCELVTCLPHLLQAHSHAVPRLQPHIVSLRPPQSFTLNQLMGVGCEEGFGVGHTRLTQTKGVWMWGEPLPVQLPSGETTHVSPRGGQEGFGQ